MDEPLTILLAIDDEADNLSLVGRVFGSNSAYSLHVAESGEAALELLLRNNPPDVLLVDQSMPGMTGVSFLREAVKVVPKAVNIMVTGYPELNDVLEAQRDGLVQHIVPKPWKPSDLVAVVKRALHLRDINSSISRVTKADV